MADQSVADQLRKLGMKGVLVQMAERGQLLALKCEMPQCYHHKGRGAFDPVTTPRTKWAPSPTTTRSSSRPAGTSFPENVRLSHTWCNQRDYGWRKQIGTLLAKGKSLDEIAEALNHRDVPPAHGTNHGRPPWCARPTCPSPGSALGAALREKRKCQWLQLHAKRQLGQLGLSTQSPSKPKGAQRTTATTLNPTTAIAVDHVIAPAATRRSKP